MIKHTIFGREGIDQKTIDQFYDAISNPYTIEAALMPDAHFGYTMPIGGVAAVDGAITWIAALIFLFLLGYMIRRML